MELSGKWRVNWHNNAMTIFDLCLSMTRHIFGIKVNNLQQYITFSLGMCGD